MERIMNDKDKVALEYAKKYAKVLLKDSLNAGTGVGYKREISVLNWFFENTKRPFIGRTFCKLAMDRNIEDNNSERFAILLAKTLSIQVARAAYRVPEEFLDIKYLDIN